MNPTDQPPTPEAVKAAFEYADADSLSMIPERAEASRRLNPYRRKKEERSSECAARILAAHARAKEAELAEKQASFDLRWKADMRAIKRWQEAHPDQELTWPDHADLVVWQQSEVARLREALETEISIKKERLIQLKSYLKNNPQYWENLDGFVTHLEESSKRIDKALTGEASA